MVAVCHYCDDFHAYYCYNHLSNLTLIYLDILILNTFHYRNQIVTFYSFLHVSRSKNHSNQ
jgi:hypothetical protein